MTPPPRAPLRATRLRDQLCAHVRYAHYSIRTEEARVYSARSYVRCRWLN